MMKRSLAEIEEEVTKLRSLAEVEERASLFECRALEAAAEAVEAFRKGEDFRQELLESCQDAYAKGTQWCKKKVAKHYLELDLDVLSLGMSSFDDESDSSGIGEGSEAALHPFDFVFLVKKSLSLL